MTSARVSRDTPALTPRVRASDISTPMPMESRLCADLGDHAVADLAAIDYVRADGVQHGLDIVVGGLVAADHDGQGAGRRAIHAAAYGRVQHGYTTGATFGVDAANHRGRVGGQVNVHVAVAGRRHDAVLAHDHGLNVAGHGQRREHGIVAGHATGRRVRPLGAHFQQVGGRFAAQVMYRELMTGLNHVGGHGVAHVADANKPSFHVVVIS